jgi:hypothetical protein
MKIACSPGRFGTTMKRLSPAHKEAISSKTSFGGLTHMHPVQLRRPMMVRLAKRYSSDKQSIYIGGTDIPITLTDVKQIMDLPIEGKDIIVHMQQPFDKNLLDAYGTEGKLLISHLEKLIIASKTPDDHFIRTFVLYTIGVILAPTTKSYVKKKYLKLVENVLDIPKFNWGFFTLNNLFSCICKFNEDDDQALQGNLPLLQVCATTLV